MEYWITTRRLARSPLGMLPQYWFTYTRLCSRLGQPCSWRPFLRFVRERHAFGPAGFVVRAFTLPFRLTAWAVREAGRRGEHARVTIPANGRIDGECR